MTIGHKVTIVSKLTNEGQEQGHWVFVVVINRRQSIGRGWSVVRLKVYHSLLRNRLISIRLRSKQYYTWHRSCY